MEARRALAEEAIFARVNAKSRQNPLDPYLDQPAASTSTRPNLFHADDLPGAVVEEEDPALQQALYESAQQDSAHVLPPAPPRAPHRYPGNGPAGRPTTASSAAATGAGNIFVKVPPPPANPPHTAAQAAGTPALDSDDELEYVDVAPSANRSAPPPPAPPSRKDQITLSDSEGSDEFEEVGVGTGGPTAGISGTVASSAEPSRTSRPTSRAPSPPQPAAPVRSLLDSILPSDSESDDDEHSPKSKSRQLPSPRKLPPTAPPRLSPSPDPFERYERAEKERQRANQVEQSEARVQSTDFAVEDAELLRRPSPRSQRDQTPSQGNLAPSDANGSYRAQLAQQTPTVTEAPKICTPSDLPTVLPPSEKALDAIETDEMAALPAVLASMPSPDVTKSYDAPPSSTNGGALATAHDPPVQYLEDLELAAIATPVPPPIAAAPPQDAASSNTKSEGKRKEVVQYLEDLENPVPGRPAPVNVDAGAEEEEFFSDWSRSPSPRPSRGAEKSSFDRQVERAHEDDSDEEEAALAMMREEEAYADVMAQLRNNSVEAMRLEAEKEVARLSAQKRAEMRNADGVTRQMAIDIRVSACA